MDNDELIARIPELIARQLAMELALRQLAAAASDPAKVALRGLAQRAPDVALMFDMTDQQIDHLTRTLQRIAQATQGTTGAS